MEIAVVSGLAALGWWLNQTPKQRQQQDEPVNVAAVAFAPPYESTNDSMSKMLNVKDTEAVQRFNDSFFPENSGIIAPFFNDIKRQTTNNDMKQRQMEMMIGNDVTWRPKRENEMLFEPKRQNIDSSGREGNTPSYLTNIDKYRSSLSQTQNATLPFAKQNVGPGVGVGPDVPAAHNKHYGMLRIIPPDGLKHKHSETGGRLNHGGFSTSSRPLAPYVTKSRPPRVWDMSSRGLEKGRAIVTGQAARGVHTTIEPVKHCQVNGEFRPGGAYRKGAYTGAEELSRTGDRSASIDVLNLTGIRPDAPGWYSNSHFDTARMEAQNRSNKGEIIGVKYQDADGLPGYYVQDAPQETNRDLTGLRSNGPGPVAPVLTKPKMYCSDAQLLKESKRSHYVENTYPAAPERTEAMQRARFGGGVSPYLQTHHTLRNNQWCIKNRITSHGDSHLTRTVPETGHVGRVPHTKKQTGEVNTRLDFSLASESLQNNPYVQQTGVHGDGRP